MVVVVAAAMEAEAMEVVAMEVEAMVVEAMVVVVVVVTEVVVTEAEDTEVAAMEVVMEVVVMEVEAMEVVVMEADTTGKTSEDHHIAIRCWTFDIVLVDSTHCDVSTQSVYSSLNTNKALSYIVMLSLFIFSSSTIRFKTGK
ncbi:uncharacterized protein LOC124287913 [Haliotis rubra]|uniref:uncharacterized protein LOC124287913 n=1 Tax=Haliotis rubra TaxID=36100 RepID=UPI001EE5E63F|nr:uncharacterized protein LOC124287906 isoform X1 [Haliotis rubra]XP_046580352.1 uncharacterized protein LOC124287906 isoform X2 [Haliotis rubra]XP_046580357.1 uncharacterized protein LOC124287913 [Haliotis rubra]